MLKRFLVLFPALLLAVSPLAAQEDLRNKLRQAAEPFERLGEVFRLSAELAGPSIVHIESTQLRPASGRSSSRNVQMQVEETGSGVVAALEGKNVILTNRHVVEGIDLKNIKIRTSDRRLLTPIRVRTNADFDLAVIEVEEPTPTPAEFGDSDRVRVGDIVLAVGSPFGLERSVSMGIVGATDRRRIPAASGRTPLCAFFQIDAAVNPGSSGGPMLNLRGEVVGLITAIATQGGGHEGVAFAMPVKRILRIARQLVHGDVAERPYIGLGFEPNFVVQELREPGLDRLVGARINRILPDGPASSAGLKVGDVILFYDGVEVEDDQHVVDLVVRSDIDKAIELRVLRNGDIFSCTITPGSQISR